MPILIRIILVGLVLFSAVTVFITMPSETQFAKSADEGYYFYFANFISENGVAQYPALIAQYVNSQEARLFPAPSRIAHILITSLWLRIFPNNLVSLAWFSYFCFILFLIFSFYFSRKHFGSDVAYFYTLLLSCSPLVMALGKRALSDINLNLFWTLSVWIFLDFIAEKKHSKFVLFLIIFSVSIMIKESSLVLVVFYSLFLLLARYEYKQNIPNYYFWLTLFGPIFLAGTAYFFLLGGLDNVFTMVRAVLGVHFGPQINEYGLQFCTGPWYRYLLDYLLLAPLTTLLFIGYFFYLLVSRKTEWKRAYFLLYFCTIFLIFSSLKYTKVVRLVVNLDVVISLFSVLFLYELFRQKNSRYQLYCVAVAVVIIFAMNYSNFIDLFYVHNIYDPISYWLLRAKGLIP